MPSVTTSILSECKYMQHWVFVGVKNLFSENLSWTGTVQCLLFIPQWVFPFTFPSSQDVQSLDLIVSLLIVLPPYGVKASFTYNFIQFYQLLCSLVFLLRQMGQTPTCWVVQLCDVLLMEYKLIISSAYWRCSVKWYPNLTLNPHFSLPHV